jgi:hypothetical protein
MLTWMHPQYPEQARAASSINGRSTWFSTSTELLFRHPRCNTAVSIAKEIPMRLVSILAAVCVVAMAASTASAAIVCNDDGDCWHVRGHAEYKPELKLRVYGDDWKWKGHKHRWREHEGRGYWRHGVWIDLG